MHDAVTHPLNTIAPYFTMFPPSFPAGALRGAEGWVLDPFCGRGTTLFAARTLGLPCIGIDASPVAAAIASAKLVDPAPDEIMALAAQLISSHTSVSVPKGEFWTLAYHPNTLRELCAVRVGLLEAGALPEVVALRAVMLGALHGPRGKRIQSYLSNQMPRTYATKPAGAVRFWHNRGLRPEYVSVAEIVRRRAERAYSNAPAPVPGQVLFADARTAHLADGTPRITRVVTSPPYYGMRTYLTDQWLRQWFLGGPEEPDYALDRQMDMSSPEAFADDLALVWRNVASVALPECQMIIRFGAIPSVESSPEAIVRRSIERTEVGWVVEGVREAAMPAGAKRQSEQFGFVRSKPIQEVDVSVVLRG